MAVVTNIIATQAQARKPSLLWCMGILLTACLIAVCLPVTFAKEIEATHEWQVLGANDTVAAGMHIRIDMSTGEKWVKIPDDSTSSSPGYQSSSTSMKEMQISAIDGEATLIDDSSRTVPGQYDYDMMYRALSKLPNDEKDRIGLPPEEEAVDRAAFEAKLKEIWAQRQDMLREVQVAELPKILKARIAELKELKEKPLEHLNSVEDDSRILEVVKDLEYHLQDIDMARDFHTLGGWTELASLLSDTVIQQAIKQEQTNTTESDTFSFIDLGIVIDNIQRLQAKVAWALGTAVKNTAEFSPYVVEYVTEPTTGVKITVLELVASHLRKYAEEHSRISEEEEEKIIKVVYCLGSFLRGNQIAQERFSENGGPLVVAKSMIKAFEASADPASMKIADRLLKIATDMVTLDDDWKWPEFCEAVGLAAQLADTSSFLDSVLAFAPSCPSWRDDASKLKSSIRTLVETMTDADDQFEKATSTLKALGMDDR